jgi:hypothetical protein
VKRMAVGVLFGFVLGFGSTVLVSLALGIEGASPSPVMVYPSPVVRFSPSPVRVHPRPVARVPVRAAPRPVKALSKPLKFSCTYVTYTTKGVDYVCFRRGAGQLRSLIHFSAGGSGMRFVLGDEFVEAFVVVGSRYRVVRVEQTPNLQGFDHVWAELIKRGTAPPPRH